jgi:hypothetical protein
MSIPSFILRIHLFSIDIDVREKSGELTISIIAWLGWCVNWRIFRLYLSEVKRNVLTSLQPINEGCSTGNRVGEDCLRIAAPAKARGSGGEVSALKVSCIYIPYLLLLK